MALTTKQSCLKQVLPQARPALAPVRSTISILRNRPALVLRSAKDDAVKQLEQFQAGVRQDLGLPQDQVTVTPLAAVVSTDGSAMGSVDGGLLELNKDSFWPFVNAQTNNLVVVDFYTDWCGPCKMIYPELVKLSLERTDVRFAKLNCNKANKEIGMQLGIKVAPTFHLYRAGTKVADMTGAKMEKLIALINEHSGTNN